MAGELGRVRGVSRDERGGATVELDGKAVALDPRYLPMVEGLSSRDRVVLVHEGRPLLPVLGRVARLDEEPDGALTFMLERSHALHRLAPADPGFADAAAVLRRAAAAGEAIAVSVDDRRVVVDLRPVPPELWQPPPELRPLPRLSWWRRYLWWPWWPFRWFFALSSTRAQQLFDDMNATSCAPTTTPAPCIPFRYPDDGCFARAEEMVRLMAAQGVTARKVWSRGWLTAPTRNHPACEVHWGWHVAPTVRVRGLFPFVRTRVIDPSLFTSPVTPDAWAAAQPVSDPLEHTDATPYFPTWSSWNPVTDAQHLAYLDDYRDALRARSLGPDGPPPYAHCP